MKRRDRRGFTLVELLVVMGIVAVLVALLLPSLGAARRQANLARARSEVANLQSALLSYYTLYSRFPRHGSFGSGMADPEASVSGGLQVNAALVRMLSGEDNPAGQNPRRVAFMEFPGGDGGFLDPWDRPYRYMCDFNYDNRVEISGYGGTDIELFGRSVAVWSTGPRGLDVVGDNLTSWD